MTPWMKAVLVTAVLLLCLGALEPLTRRWRKPSRPDFRCTKCGKRARHNTRTIAAWRRLFDRLWCDDCFFEWWHRRLPKRHDTKAQPSAAGGLLLIAAALAALAYWLL